MDKSNYLQLGGVCAVWESDAGGDQGLGTPPACSPCGQPPLNPWLPPRRFTGYNSFIPRTKLGQGAAFQNQSWL